MRPTRTLPVRPDAVPAKGVRRPRGGPGPAPGGRGRLGAPPNTRPPTPPEAATEGRGLARLGRPGRPTPFRHLSPRLRDLRHQHRAAAAEGTSGPYTLSATVVAASAATPGPPLTTDCPVGPLCTPSAATVESGDSLRPELSRRDTRGPADRSPAPRPRPWARARAGPRPAAAGTSSSEPRCTSRPPPPLRDPERVPPTGPWASIHTGRRGARRVG